MVPRENKNNAYAKLGGQTKSVIVSSEVAYFNSLLIVWLAEKSTCSYFPVELPTFEWNLEMHVHIHSTPPPSPHIHKLSTSQTQN